MKRVKTGFRFLFIITHLALILGAYSMLFNQFVSPQSIPIFQLAALAFPLLFILSIAMCIVWIFVDWRYALLTTFFTSFLLFPFNSWYKFTPPKIAEKGDLKVLSYNVRYFYDNRKGIQDLFAKELPDVILIQEMGANPEATLPTTQKYYFENKNSVGIASKYPILESGSIKAFPPHQNANYADIKLENDTIRIINVYLSSVHIDKKLVKQAASLEGFEESSGTIITKLFTGFNKHKKEVDKIREYIQRSPHPVILGGDFNAVPYSYEYFNLRRGLNDAFTGAGSGMATTFHEYRFPLRIDYLFHSPQIKATHFQIKKVNYSDHFPIIAEFQLP